MVDNKNGTWDYAYIYTNADILCICKTESISNFVMKQQLKWLAHVIRMDNSTLEKQTLFMEGGKDVWRDFERYVCVDRTQLRKIMFDKKRFDGWLNKLV